MFSLSLRSLKNLEGVHPDICSIMTLAIQYSPVDFAIIEGLRSQERQALLYKSGRSKTMQSKHLRQADGYGHAVDVMACGVTDIWDINHYRVIAAAVVKAASDLKLSIVWGGTWKNFVDGPHFQLP